MPAGRADFYTAFLDSYTAGCINLIEDDLSVMLMSPAYKPRLSQHTLGRDIDIDEVKGVGYTAGGQRLTGRRWERQGTGRALHADNVAWQQAHLSARYAVVYRDNDTRGNLLVCCFDFGEVKTASGGPFLIEWPEDGLLSVRAVVE
jgi:hypothetical protein